MTAPTVNRERLVATAVDLVSISSPTGFEQPVGEYVREVFRSLGLQVLWQEVEEGRPNVVGTLEGTGGGKSLMFNGHMDTSYSGREPWLLGIAGFQPQGFVEDDHVWGLGISNMKGALACYIETVRALQDAGVRLRGDVLVACVSGEIEKAQWGEEYAGREWRGYSAGSRFLASHGGIADMCILGEPTSNAIVTGHYGAVWLRISTHGPFMHTAYTAGRLEENSIVRMHDVIAAVREWIPEWQERTTYAGEQGIVNLGCVNGGFPWRASRTPERTDLFVDARVPPTLPMTDAVAELKAMARGLRDRFPEHGIEVEVYVTAPGSEIAEEHPLVQSLDRCHTEVFGSPPPRATVRWFSDASSLTRYGIQSVNYGMSSGAHGAEGENLAIDGLVQTTEVYVRTAMDLCGVAS
ncbi:MAG: M20/M25/M40 family metallo-hydrolase [Gaiella sp.]|nr:M20/M25/M40 family metallo-hydrolase [Gaiella sp.]